jgi:hypothetical protein
MVSSMLSTVLSGPGIGVAGVVEVVTVGKEELFVHSQVPSGKAGFIELYGKYGPLLAHVLPS